VNASRGPWTIFSALVLAACSAATPATLTPDATPTASPGTPGATSISILPGEQWFAYYWFVEGENTRGLFVARPDGSGAHPIVTDVAGEHKGPTWSPDGTKIAFEVFDEQTPDGSIWMANADGSGAKLVFDGGQACVAVVHPAWSPDGSKLAMICYPESSGVHSSVATLDVGSMAVTTITTVASPEALDNAPRWSPDGASVAFPILHWDPTGDHLDGSLVAVVPAAGGQVRRLTTFDTFMSSPDWRPDGSELVMNSYDLGNIQMTDRPSNIYAIRPDGTGLRQLTHSSVDGAMRITTPRPAPDGTQIYVSVATTIPPMMTVDCVRPAVMDAGGGEPTLLWTSGACAAGAELRPTP
jgi:Tol biopolymer transport system component